MKTRPFTTSELQTTIVNTARQRWIRQNQKHANVNSKSEIRSISSHPWTRAVFWELKGAVMFKYHHFGLLHVPTDGTTILENLSKPLKRYKETFWRRSVKRKIENEPTRVNAAKSVNYVRKANLISEERHQIQEITRQWRRRRRRRR